MGGLLLVLPQHTLPLRVKDFKSIQDGLLWIGTYTYLNGSGNYYNFILVRTLNVHPWVVC